MSDDHLDKLLKAMPEIARAVNGFDSPDVQRDAFGALMKAATGDLPQEPQRSNDTKDQPEKQTQRTRSKPKKAPSEGAKQAATTKSNTRRKLPSIAVDEALDIEPHGEVSLPDFATEKQPKTLQDQSMVIIYWLKHNAKFEKVGISQIFTCYKRMGWKAPAIPSNQLSKMASRYKWLDTSKPDDVSLTHAGSQYVEHDLPLKSPK